MKTALLIIFILSAGSIFACQNSVVNKCSTSQATIVELSQSETDDCCSEYCFCNCCNHISINILINNTKVVDNNMVHPHSNINQNISGYLSLPWQPPNF
ncbi:MAG: hypothetical protein HND52_19355 [Ignavibacteriae bacterium]|nr:hypothetical protein [Ignavibacteriota bacterium]NOH00124.1 hypothetical protein [Ignavibacteriota bacterium]